MDSILFDHCDNCDSIVIKKNVKHEPVYNNMDLSSKVYCYHNGIRWIIVNSSFMNQFPIFHDFYHSNIDDLENKNIMTIYSCPYTNLSLVLDGEFSHSKFTYKKNLVLKMKNVEDEYFVPILDNFYDHNGKIIKNKSANKRELLIMTLKNVNKLLFDPLFINYSDNNNRANNCDKIIYVISYLSKIEHVKKYTVLKPMINSCDIDNNGMSKYIKNMMKKIREKFGLIVPCYLEDWMNVHQNTKIINVE